MVSAPLAGDIAKNLASHEARDQATALVSKVCGDETGMQAIGSDTRTLQAASEFTREQDVA